MKETKQPLTEFRTYTVKEVATTYFPHIQPNSASRSLSRIIRGDRMLSEELSMMGYYKGIKTLTPAMVRTIKNYLGAPNDFIN